MLSRELIAKIVLQTNAIFAVVLAFTVPSVCCINFFFCYSFFLLNCKSGWITFLFSNYIQEKLFSEFYDRKKKFNDVSFKVLFHLKLAFNYRTPLNVKLNQSIKSSCSSFYSLFVIVYFHYMSFRFSNCFRIRKLRNRF